jgi:hypothetical protein
MNHHHSQLLAHQRTADLHRAAAQQRLATAARRHRPASDQRPRIGLRTRLAPLAAVIHRHNPEALGG